MSVTLQPLDVEFAEEPQAAEPELAEETAAAPEAQEAAEPTVGHPEMQEVVPVPQPKKRGRPPKLKIKPQPPPPKPAAKPKPKAKPKAPPPESSEEESDEDLANMYRHAARPDMETSILQFLVNRRQSEADRRKTLWSQLARMYVRSFTEPKKDLPKKEPSGSYCKSMTKS